MTEQHCDILIAGAGTGGVAAALAAAEAGCSVILTEETDWIGGQLTSQAVPPDEHRWIESFGSTARYRAFRDGVRAYYRDHYPLTASARRSPPEPRGWQRVPPVLRAACGRNRAARHAGAAPGQRSAAAVSWPCPRRRRHRRRPRHCRDLPSPRHRHRRDGERRLRPRRDRAR